MPTLPQILSSAVRPRKDVQLVGTGEPDTPLPVYEIWSRSQNKKVGEVTTREGATRAVDRRDIAHGGYDHYFKRPGDK